MTTLQTLTPFPRETVRLEDGRRAVVRPLRPEDERLYPAFDACLSEEDRRLRFFSPVRMSAGLVRTLTHFDRTRAAALAAIDPGSGALLGVARLHRSAGERGEFAVLVRSDLKGVGLGRALMERILRWAEPLGIRSVYGSVLPENGCMLALALELGFTLRHDPGDPNLILVERPSDTGRPAGLPEPLAA